ncbi:ALF repeat-containing protein [Kitasatospora sp. NPDC056651]|uniref:ALF repeat-containing protein n=1 Tax=Kitasatospora sp. NPDC056651 TaxID=3345892 RepID=UPI0036A1EFB4
MKLPRVSAVVAAAVLAPVVLFPSSASAADAPKPTGISGPDTGSDSAKDTAPQDATPQDTASKGAGAKDTTPEGADDQEQRDRAEVERILANSPAESWCRVHEGAAKALKGTAADLRHFLESELDGLQKSDNRLLVARLRNGAGPVLDAAARAAINAGDDAIAEFLKTGQYTARAEDEDRARIEAILADPKTGRGVREGAEKALKGTAADLRHFLEVSLPRLRADDNRVKLSQLMSSGGPAVREAAGKALDAGTDEAVEEFLDSGFAKAQAQDNRVKVSQIAETGGPAVKKAALAALEGSDADITAFLNEGWAKARAEDEAATTTPGSGNGSGSGSGTGNGSGGGNGNAGTGNGSDNGAGSGTGTDGSGQQPQPVQPAGYTGTTGTATTTTATGTGTGTLAATGTDGLGWEAGGAAAALAAGAALVVAARRRSTES